MRSNEKYDKDPRTSEDAVQAYRQALEAGEQDLSLAIVHYRGGHHEFTLGAAYAKSLDCLDRETGAWVLSQLGWGDDCFHGESVSILVSLLHDPVPRVVAAAAAALGHRIDRRVIPDLLGLIEHPDPSVRLGVVGGLIRLEDVAAVQGLVTFTKDVDDDVRNWAAFGLGSMTDLDLPELRDALVALLDDPDPEIRGEALIGLARRNDPRVKEPLIREIQGSFHGNWSLEAAELLGDPSLLQYLCEQEGRLPAEDKRFKENFDRAILACGGRKSEIC